MASTRRGLGRGLNSLLGGTADEILNPEPKKEPERIVVEEKEPEKETLSAAAVPPPGVKPAREVISAEEIYRSNEDNVTIKGVVSRDPKRAEEPKQEDKGSVNELPLHSIVPNPDQPRINFKKEELQELADSIRKDGLLQPVVVRNMGDDEYQIIAGERRWQACRLLGLENVPVRIVDVDDNKAIELALIENIQRSDLNPIEEAYGYRRMMERCNMTQSEVAQAVSKGRSTIANALRLLELPEEAQQLLFEEKITAGHARAILSVSTDEGRRTLTRKIVDEKLNVRDAENLACLLSGVKTTKTTSRSATPKSFKTVARSLRESLETNVRVKTVKGKNKIEIEFQDEDDLQRLFKIISGETE